VLRVTGVPPSVVATVKEELLGVVAT